MKFLVPPVALAAGGIVVWACLVYLRKRKAVAIKISHIPWDDVSSGTRKDVLVVDCTHDSLPCMTHHRLQRPPFCSGIHGDTTSDLVLSSIEKKITKLADISYVTVNHFDIDALEFADELRECAHIGDFRELDLSRKAADKGLKLCCWLNTMEARNFSRPFEHGDADKWPYFLTPGRFLQVLRNPEAFSTEWKTEYEQVHSGLSQIAKSGRIRRYEDIDLCVIESPEPVHYYSLFSHTRGFDVVLSSYGAANRMEIEQKYTQFVNLDSRPTFPRIEMITFTEMLNQLEQQHRNSSSGKAGKADGTEWVCERIVDTGPLLRLDRPAEKLSKAARYGHPFQRPIYPSHLPLDLVERLLVSYLRHALRGVSRRARWTWAEVHEVNKAVDWSGWLAQAAQLATAAQPGAAGVPAT